MPSRTPSSSGSLARVLCFVLIACITTSRGDELQDKALDQQLFESLDDDLFSDLPPVDALEPAEKRPERTEPSQDDPRNSERERGLELSRSPGGEDVSPIRGLHPLKQVADAMRRVEAKLGADDTSSETQELQRRIVDDLDRLLAMLEKQSKSRASSRQESSASRDKTAANARQPSRTPPTSDLPAPDSNTPSGRAESDAVTQSERARWMEKVWGNLPAAARRQMQSTRPETFLPKYSRLIEDYFKALAEGPSER